MREEAQTVEETAAVKRATGWSREGRGRTSVDGKVDTSSVVGR
jgi:hypothetical protein